MLEEIVAKEYYPPSKEAIIYINSLPEYAKYQDALNALPSSGSYRLPVQEAASQLSQLLQQFSENFRVNKNKPDYEIPRSFFEALPGVKNVKFQAMTVSYLNGRHSSFGGRNLLTVTLPSQQEDSKAKFASAFSSCNPIPYGFRLEMLAQNHYLVRALAQTPTDGLVDFTVEMKGGKLITLSGIVVQKPTCQMLY